MESLIAITEGSGKNVSTQQMTIAGQTVEIERSMMGMGVLTMPASPQIDGVNTPATHYPNDAVDVQGRYYIILKPMFSSSSNSATIRLAFYDSEDVLIGYSDPIDIQNTAILDTGGDYFGQLIAWANVLGAKTVKVYLVSVSAGTISFFVGAV
jgi:hypothetical protein